MKTLSKLWLSEERITCSADLTKRHKIFPEDDDLDQPKIATRVLGRKASQFLNISEVIKERILNTINDNLYIRFYS